METKPHLLSQAAQVPGGLLPLPSHGRQPGSRKGTSLTSKVQMLMASWQHGL